MIDLLQTHIGLTTRCNLRCPHCYSAKERQRKNEFDISLKNLEIILQRLSRYGVFKIIFAYAESLLFDYFWEAIALTNKYGFDIELTTNAVELDGETIKKLSVYGVDKIQISLDFPNEEHDIFRNYQGLFKKVTQALQLLSKNGHFRTRILCTQWSDNIEFYNKFKELADMYNIDVVAFLSSQTFNSEVSEKISNIIKIFSKDKRFVFHSPFFTPKDCFVGRILHINPWGYFTPCPLSNKILGNILTISDTDLDTLINNIPKLICLNNEDIRNDTK